MKTDRKALARRVAEAVLDVPGVACLRPGLRGLLHTAAGTRPPAARLPDDPGSAVRITFDARGRAASLHIDVVVRAQHQAARTARAVRAAAAEAAATAPGAVRVTVTGIV
ncbi:Asp23/Gls24 family envelope stress response protein [Streptomyces flavotricini]|uniref:Asp23/Gls24 family envelope stress response protein n=2 Tax=Streptomyces TaxID=1883 RepID=A0ABS8DX35_9ACTN|nr:Asp23/Gls24 family envelope stress response protein [Streptomyces flavotricini]MCC0093378.1 Asp23/Gls24 family envelope stress response protein [Streptomyces flavotricini]